MGRYQITAPDGRTVIVEGATPPNDEQAQEIFKSLPPDTKDTAPPETPSVLGRFASRTGFAGLSQVPGAIADVAGQGVVGGTKALAGGLAGTAGAVAGEFAPSAIASQYQHLRGQGMTPVGSALGSIPLLGKTAETISGDIVGGKIPEIAGDIVSAAPMLLGVKSFRESPAANAPIRPPAIPSELGPALKSVAKDTIAGPAAAGAVGGFVAGPVGAGVAAGTVRLAQAIAEKVTAARQAEVAARQAVAAHVETAATGAQASAFESMMNAWKAAAERVKAEESAAARLEATREKYRGLSSPQELKMAKDQIAAQEIDAKARGLSPDEFKIQRDYLDALDMDMRRATADTKAQEAASIAGAKAELKPLEAADAAAGKQIAAAERTATKGEAQGQKIDLKQISRAVRANKAAAAERAKQETAREAASIAGAKAELKPLELSQKAQPKNPVLTQIEGEQAVKGIETPKAPAAPSSLNPVLEFVEKGKPQVSVPALEKASLLEDAVKIANQMILDGYDKPNTKSALLQTFKKRGIDEALADKVVNAIDAPTPAEILGYRSDALIWADAKLTPMEIFDKLSGKMGRERALRTGYEAVKSIPAAARTAEQAAEVIQFDKLLGGRKSLKNKVKPEMIKRSRDLKPLEPSPDPNRPGSRTNP